MIGYVDWHTGYVGKRSAYSLLKFAAMVMIIEDGHKGQRPVGGF